MTPATVSYPVHEPHCNDQCVHYLETDQAAGTRKSPDGLHGDSREGGQSPRPKKEHVNDSTGVDPQTEAGRRDHDDAWTPEGDPWTMSHDAMREGCRGCAKIAAIEAEARAPYITNMQRLAEANEAYGREIDRLAEARALPLPDALIVHDSLVAYDAGRADALREAADAVRALPGLNGIGCADTILAILDPQP